MTFRDLVLDVPGSRHSAIGMLELTRDKMVAFFQTTFKNAFS